MEGPPVSLGSAGSRPLLGFPLAIILLSVVMFILAGISSCCYHWNEIRRSFSLYAAEDDRPRPSNPKPSSPLPRKKESLPVMMPGDAVPKFIALTCPREPPRLEKITVEGQQRPPWPRRTAVPFYALGLVPLTIDILDSN